MKEIVLNIWQKNNPNYRKYSALVDDEDFEKLNKYKWHVKKGKKSNVLYAVGIVDGKKCRMHNIVMNDVYIDHIDRNGLNNQKSNLRKCTHVQNLLNRESRKGYSKFKGLTRVWRAVNKTQQQMWKAQIKFQKQYYSIGVFATEEEAALAYNEKAKELHGEFAYLNEVSRTLKTC